MTKRSFDAAQVIAADWAREGCFDRASANVESRTIELSFSSEAPVERWYGSEVLAHTAAAVNLDRLGSGRANMLINHDPGDWVGVIESARVEDKRGRAVVRFGNSARAREIFQDVTDGILSSVSVGYRVEDIKLTRSTDAGDEYTVTRWMPYEVSLVTVPADESVGVGRSATPIIPAIPATTQEVPAMTDVAAPAGTTAATAPANSGARVIDHGPNAVELENARQRGISNLCRANKIDDKIRDYWINAGISLDAISDDLLKIIEQRGATNPQPATQLGLTPTETRRFSLQRAIHAVAEKDWTQAGFELECSRAIAQKLGKAPNPTTFFVPFEIQQRGHATPIEDLAYRLMKRDLTVASGSGGGYLVDTVNVGFIELLRNRSVAYNMGAIRLSGLQGSVTVPKQTGAATAYWLASESTQATESQQTFGQMALSPKTVGAYTEISRQLLLQSSPDAESIVMSDLAASVALAADLAVLNGSGASGQPTGIINTAGIGSVTGTSLAYAGIIEFQTDVAAANVSGNGYVTTPAVAGLLKQRVKFSGTASPLWDGRLEDAVVDGYRGMSSNQMPSANMIYGDWSKVVIGEWGVLEVQVNPYANFQAGIIGVRALYTMDVGVRYAGAFSLATSIT